MGVPDESSVDFDALTEQAATLIRQGDTDHPVVAQVASRWARRAAARLNREALPGAWEDAFADCTVEILDLLHDYRPGPVGSSAAAYLGACLPRVVSAVQGHARWHDDQRLRKASAIVSAARADLQSFDPWVHDDDVYNEALARVHGQVIETARKEHPDWSETELFDYARMRARKDGMDRAFADLRRGSDEFADPVSLDVPDADGSPRFDVPGGVGPGVQDEDNFESMLRVVLGDQMWARPALGVLFATDVDGDSPNSLAAAAKLVKSTPKKLQELRKTARLRAASPHAHWAHLSPSIASTPDMVRFRDA